MLSVKLQKRDQDVLEAYAIVDEVMKTLESTRKTIDTGFAAWYDEIVKLENEVGATESVPQITTLQPFLSWTISVSRWRNDSRHMKQITPIVFPTLCHLYWSPHPCTLITS